MSNLNGIARRHIRDRWMDALFIGAAVLLAALSIGSVTSKVAGQTSKQWSVTVVETNVQVLR
ncbi:MAG: hypothetical protein AB7O24_21830 [Kofleriaceae bacterium]